MFVYPYLVIVLLTSVFAVDHCCASAPAVATATQRSFTTDVPFAWLDHGVIIECPEVSFTESKRQQLQAVVEKAKAGTLMQHDQQLKDLIEMPAGAKECECRYLHRSNGWRHSFERAMVARVNAMKLDKSKSFSYINFSAGLGFQDMVLVSHLVDAGFKNIEVNMVDGYYQPLGVHLV